MPLNQRSLELLNSVIETEADEQEFNAGYELGKNSETKARIGGRIDGDYEGIFVAVRDFDESGTWLADKVLDRGPNTTAVFSAPFVLGSIVAALEAKLTSAPQASL